MPEGSTNVAYHNHVFSVKIRLIREIAVAGVHVLGDVGEVQGRLHEIHRDAIVVGICYGRPNHALVRSAVDKFRVLEEAVVVDAGGERGVGEVDFPIREVAGSRGPCCDVSVLARRRGIARQDAALYNVEDMGI